MVEKTVDNYDLLVEVTEERRLYYRQVGAERDALAKRVEGLEVERDVAVEENKDLRDLLPYCQDCSDFKVGLAERLESCPICGLGPICERCMGQHTTDVHDTDDPARVLYERVQTLESALKEAREVLDKARREGRHGPMCDRSRCVCWKSGARAAITVIDAALGETKEASANG
jgi:hypothetical protein